MKRAIPLIIPLFLFLSLLPVIGNAEAERNKVRIGYLQSDIHQLTCWVAMEKRFYRKNGVDAKVAGVFRAGPEEMSAFAAGALDMGYVGEAPTTTAVANGVAKATVLAQAKTEGSVIMVKKGSSIKSPPTFRGKPLPSRPFNGAGFPASESPLQIQGGSQKGCCNCPKTPEMIGALETGQIDGFIAWEPYPAKAQTMGVGEVLLTSNQIWKNHPCCVLLSDRNGLSLMPFALCCSSVLMITSRPEMR